MKHRHSAALLITAGLFTAGVVAPADAIPGGNPLTRCTGFHAKGAGVDDGMGTTTATLYRGRRELATTVGTFTLTGVDADGVATFTGTIILSNDQGMLTAPVEGTLDTVSGRFASLSDDVTGTGEYADTTGRLRFRGVEDLQGLTFTEHVYGKLCVPKDKKPK
jgi:hypothetical protein